MNNIIALICKSGSTHVCTKNAVHLHTLTSTFIDGLDGIQLSGGSLSMFAGDLLLHKTIIPCEIILTYKLMLMP